MTTANLKVTGSRNSGVVNVSWKKHFLENMHKELYEYVFKCLWKDLDTLHQQHCSPFR